MMKSMSISAVLKFTRWISLLLNDVWRKIFKFYKEFTKYSQRPQFKQKHCPNYWSLKIKIKQVVDKLLHLLGIFLSTTQERLI